MVNCDPEGGKIVWLENPGNSEPYWESHYIGRATSMHRLKVGYFTQEKKLQVLGLPIVGRPNDVHSITPIVLFTEPDNLYEAKEWQEEFLKIYDKKYYDNNNKKPDPKDGVWYGKEIGLGELTQVNKTGFKGSGDVDAGKVGDDKFAYIAAVESFHGNTNENKSSQTA